MPPPRGQPPLLLEDQGRAVSPRLPFELKPTGGWQPTAPPTCPPPHPTPTPTSTQAYVGNIPFEVDEPMVEHFFRGLQV